MLFVALFDAQDLVGHSFFGQHAVDEASFVLLHGFVDFFLVDLGKH